METYLSYFLIGAQTVLLIGTILVIILLIKEGYKI